MKYLKYLVIIIIFLSSSILTAYAYFDNNQTRNIQETSYITVIVDTGDSFWNLAQQHNSGNYSTKKLVTQIKALNELEGYTIFPGQELIIPL